MQNNSFIVEKFSPNILNVILHAQSGKNWRSHEESDTFDVHVPIILSNDVSLDKVTVRPLLDDRTL